jgi:hypothetical protein
VTGSNMISVISTCPEASAAEHQTAPIAAILPIRQRVRRPMIAVLHAVPEKDQGDYKPPDNRTALCQLGRVIASTRYQKKVKERAF